MLVRAAMVIGACGVLGCSGDPSEVESSRDVRSPTLTEEIRIDGMAEDFVPIRGGGLSVAEDGIIAVRQQQDLSVRVYDAEGRFVRSVGQEGEGPGEFMWMAQMGWVGDTLWVHDTRLSRVTRFMPDGTLLRTDRVPASVTPLPEDADRLPAISFVGLRDMLDESYLASLFTGSESRSTTSFAGGQIIARVDWEGTIQNVIGFIPVTEEQIELPGGGIMVAPYQNRPEAAMSRRSGRFATVVADLEGSRAGTFSVTAIDLNGDTLYVTDHPFEPVPISGSDRESVIQSLRRRAGSQALEIPVPEYYPPIERVVVGLDGTVWVELRVEDGVREYVVFEPDGAVLGSVLMSELEHIDQARRDEVWVLEKDAFDTESVVRYGVEWQ